jgi:hypothetical protein
MNNPHEQPANLLNEPVGYDPNNLLDSLIEKLHLEKRCSSCHARLEVAPPVISKIRHRRLPVGASLLIRMHEVSDLSIRELRILMGDRRDKFRISDKQFKPKNGSSGSESEYDQTGGGLFAPRGLACQLFPAARLMQGIHLWKDSGRRDHTR